MMSSSPPHIPLHSKYTDANNANININTAESSSNLPSSPILPANDSFSLSFSNNMNMNFHNMSDLNNFNTSSANNTSINHNLHNSNIHMNSLNNPNISMNSNTSNVLDYDFYETEKHLDDIRSDDINSMSIGNSEISNQKTDLTSAQSGAIKHDENDKMHSTHQSSENEDEHNNDKDDGGGNANPETGDDHNQDGMDRHESYLNSDLLPISTYNSTKFELNFPAHHTFDTEENDQSNTDTNLIQTYQSNIPESFSTSSVSSAMMTENNNDNQNIGLSTPLRSTTTRKNIKTTSTPNNFLNSSIDMDDDTLKPLQSPSASAHRKSQTTPRLTPRRYTTNSIHSSNHRRSKSKVSLDFSANRSPVNNIHSTPNHMNHAASTGTGTGTLNHSSSGSSSNGSGNPFYIQPFATPRNSHKKQKSISTNQLQAMNLNHLDVDLKLGYSYNPQLENGGSPLATPLRTPGGLLTHRHNHQLSISNNNNDSEHENENDEFPYTSNYDDEDDDHEDSRDSINRKFRRRHTTSGVDSSFVSPYQLMKDVNGGITHHDTPIKRQFGGKLIQEQVHQTQIDEDEGEDEDGVNPGLHVKTETGNDNDAQADIDGQFVDHGFVLPNQPITQSQTHQDEYQQQQQRSLSHHQQQMQQQKQQVNSQRQLLPPQQFNSISNLGSNNKMFLNQGAQNQFINQGFNNMNPMHMNAMNMNMNMNINQMGMNPMNMNMNINPNMNMNMGTNTNQINIAMPYQSYLVDQSSQISQSVQHSQHISNHSNNTTGTGSANSSLTSQTNTTTPDGFNSYMPMSMAIDERDELNPSILVPTSTNSSSNSNDYINNSSHFISQQLSGGSGGSGGFISPGGIVRSSTMPLLSEHHMAHSSSPGTSQMLMNQQRRPMQSGLVRSNTTMGLPTVSNQDNISPQIATPKRLSSKLTRSRSSLNLSSIAQSKEARTAASRSSSSASLLTPPVSASGSIPSQLSGPVPFPVEFDDKPKRQTRTRKKNTSISASMDQTSSFHEPDSQSHLDGGMDLPSHQHPLVALTTTEAMKSISPNLTPKSLDLPRQSSRSKSRSKSSAELDKKKVHECPLCHSKFQRPEHVKRHMRSHSSEKPFICPQPNCGKRFNRNDNLKQHLKKIHQLLDK